MKVIALSKDQLLLCQIKLYAFNIEFYVIDITVKWEIQNCTIPFAKV